ncbi:hypothetical protein FRC98_10590 [Lujinxingia vulgaris]|uniref:Uncharacterized protein n=1 Tax=Lujinxingia vulgaris TaxID=2600176 RepID=A0A5C6XIT4_9DELT|nr:hypothetical protein [Lujinxingia vulgaris]TXD37172.1 hypothetical protein FRC98_10590 [Lujinxingia vulgaris]
MMYGYTLKTLERHVLSPARRLFVYDQMKAVAAEHQLTSLCHRIDEAHRLDTLNVERATRWRQWSRMERTHPGIVFAATTADELRESAARGQQELLSLIYFIVHSAAFDHGELRDRLLEPLHQHIRRLEHYADRATDQAACVESPTSRSADELPTRTRDHAFVDSPPSSIH